MSKLIIIALLCDLFTPILIWKANLPAQFRWLSLVVLAIVLAVAYVC